jgi:hypothetical protein
MNFSKDQIENMPAFFDRYINQVDNLPLTGALRQTQNLFESIPQPALNKLAGKVYAPGKWTVKEVIQHLLDMERVLAYRALVFARNSSVSQASINEQDFACFASAETRSIQALAGDFRLQRQSTIRLFKSFTPGMARRSGIAAGQRISVLALGFVIAGHTLHHLRIIRENYLPLVS